MKVGQKALKFASRHNLTLNNVVVTFMQLCRCCTVRMHASFVVNILFMKLLLQMEAAAASLLVQSSDHFCFRMRPCQQCGIFSCI